MESVAKTAPRSKTPTDRLLQIGDIVLTAAAHHPRYNIGAKVDLIATLFRPAGTVAASRAAKPHVIPPAG